jgi:hypothetical protein
MRKREEMETTSLEIRESHSITGLPAEQVCIAAVE